MMFKVTFYVKQPPGCTGKQFIEYLESEILDEPLDDDNPLEYHVFSNDVEMLTISEIPAGKDGE